MRTGCEQIAPFTGEVSQFCIHCSMKRKAEGGDRWGCAAGRDHWRDLYVVLRRLDYAQWSKKNEILEMVYAELWSDKISVLGGSGSTNLRRTRHLVVSPGGRLWGHEPGQYCRNGDEGAKSRTICDVKSAGPIITTEEGEEGPRMLLMYLPYMTGWPISQST